MCGIAVAFHWPDAVEAVSVLIAGLEHRGDRTDPMRVLSPTMALQTRRLAIVDPDRGVQPMASDDGRWLVALNGEIYNHTELRAQLEGEGVRFRSQCDTEVLANALGVWGEQALRRVNGMYAFVALDVQAGDFLAGRDDLGVKPLYVRQAGQRFLFCSEMSPLLAVAGDGDVLAVPPGALFSSRAIAAPRVKEPIAMAARDETRVLDGLLAAAVRRRMPNDLSCAVLMSGGIDSTLVAHYARQARPETPGYFLGGADSPDYRYAASYAEATGMDLRIVPLDADADVEALISKTVREVEGFEPDLVRGALCTTTLCAALARDGVKVALSGEGADELFAGYVHLEMAYDFDEEAGVFVREQHLALMHRMGLQRLDRGSMRKQVEVREPFLDPDVVAFALGLTGRSLLETIDGAPRGKAPLRRLYDLYPDALPRLIRDRAKVPLNIGCGFDTDPRSGPWARYADAMFSDAQFAAGAARFAVFDPRTKEELLYLTKLAEHVDVFRVPHLAQRSRVRFPTLPNMEKLAPYVV